MEKSNESAKPRAAEPAQEMVCFFGEDDPLSNWHRAPFVVKGFHFETVEHFMMFCKAKLFGDEARAKGILATPHPREAKALGRAVAGYVEEVWVAKREGYVEKGCLEKFRQNPLAAQRLLGTGAARLVEASPYDKVWGAGLAAKDPRMLDPSQWPGLNLLGVVLERARGRLDRELRAAEEAGSKALERSSRKFHKDGSQPKDGSVFVFGSNLAGRHGRGSAAAAAKFFGAKYGVGEGRQGQSYGIPTKDGRPGAHPLGDPRAALPLAQVGASIERFVEHAKAHPEEGFFVVRVGCELAGYKDAQIAPLFKDAPMNVSLPEPWGFHLQSGPRRPGPKA